jgi:hypothetical protein
MRPSWAGAAVSGLDDLRAENERLTRLWTEKHDAHIEYQEQLKKQRDEARDALRRFSEALTGPVAVEALTSHLQVEWAGPYMARIRDFTEEEVKAGKLREADEAAEDEARKVAAAALAAAVEAAKKEAGP